MLANDESFGNGEEVIPMILEPVPVEKIRRGRGRPFGSKDAFPRIRRSKFGLPSIPSLDIDGSDDESSMQQVADPLQTSIVVDAVNNDPENVAGEEQQHATVKVGEKRSRTDAGRKKDLFAQQERRKKMKDADVQKLIDEENALRDPKWLKSTVKSYSTPLFRTLNYAEGNLRRGFLNQNQPTHAGLCRTAIIQMHRMVVEMSRPPRESAAIQPDQVEDVLRTLIDVLHRRFSKTERNSDNALPMSLSHGEHDDIDDEDDEEMLDLVDEAETNDAND